MTVSDAAVKKSTIGESRWGKEPACLLEALLEEVSGACCEALGERWGLILAGGMRGRWGGGRNTQSAMVQNS